MNTGIWRWLALFVVIGLILAWWMGCFKQDANVLVVAPLPGAPQGTTTRIKLPPSAHHKVPRVLNKPAPPADGPLEKMHPLINDWITAGKAGDRERFIVLWEDAIPMPPFPELDLTQPLTAAVNDTALARSRRIVVRLADLRRPIFERDTTRYAVMHGALAIESYWIAQAMLMEMEVGEAVRIAGLPRVAYVMPDSSGERPPAGCTTARASEGPFISDARGAIATDLYRSEGYPDVWLALFDTGIKEDHELLTGDAVSSAQDCVDGNADCVGGNPADVNVEGHGTGSAAIIAAGDAWDDYYRGVTDLGIHSFRVYEASAATGTILNSAVMRAFQRGVSHLDRVIVAEIASASTANGAISVAADNAFAAGAVVVAASGNDGEDNLRAPANARRALSVGAYMLDDGSTDPGQSYGTTTDGRVKPDLQAPTLTWTASNMGTDQCLQLAQTSGATPYAGGAAALARGWLKNAIGDDQLDPGQVMAFMMASTEEQGTIPDEQRGAGLLVLPTGGWAWFGKVTFTAEDVSDDDTVPVWDIPIDLTGRDVDELDAAIWWPERPSSTRANDNDIDLELLDSDGDVEEASQQADGVYERLGTQISTSEQEEWTLRISGFSLKHPPQDVYYIVFARPRSGGTEPPTPN